jgi:hypothetical protein
MVEALEAVSWEVLDACSLRMGGLTAKILFSLNGPVVHGSCWQNFVQPPTEGGLLVLQTMKELFSCNDFSIREIVRATHLARRASRNGGESDK